MNLPRSSGILLHPTSFPGRYGVGELGASAYAFLDWLYDAGQQWWQVLPLGPTGYGDSPYQSFSAFAGNPYLISFDDLKKEGLLTEEDLQDTPDFLPGKVDYGWIYIWKFQKLQAAYTHFKNGAFTNLKAEFATFKAQEDAWLEDYALFMALKDENGGLPWNAWDLPIRQRKAQAMQDARIRLADDIERISFYQFLFFRAWTQVRAYAHSKGIQVIGDIPIFVAMDSADAWANPDQFYFDDLGQPTVVAGVPPDYFSETGQLWGNPLYRWDVMQAQGFQWWIERIKGCLKLYDLVRIDHFRGFEAYWEIQYPAENAIDGQWVKAPGKELFKTILDALGEIPIIAEDLGVITEEVEDLRDSFGFPGMAILQFAFGGGDWASNAFLPENLKDNQIVYSGTHDNDTTRGWFNAAKEDELTHLNQVAGSEVTEDRVAWVLTEMAWRSRARVSIVPLQDVLNLDTAARMNLPGSLSDSNWSWRYPQGALSPFVARRLKSLTQEAGRYVQPRVTA
ncbi:4-alpha-glucanotransferase [Deinococcus roseus]|uniref:4-alpha-glucanotransferase n=1 Tax=Deinococcus roseus TaxID=392414 RepID=A0ABQ2CXK1_9DEIO|nr:4-alpha-glucanotransferase [Deinococcus roseus]GGJ30427.1 4-alpha-glucanotransferase [Deinococcus roseus]